jgi:hypothetical protein
MGVVTDFAISQRKESANGGNFGYPRVETRLETSPENVSPAVDSPGSVTRNHQRIDIASLNDP